MPNETNRECYESVKEYAKRRRISERTVYRHIKKNLVKFRQLAKNYPYEILRHPERPY